MKDNDYHLSLAKKLLQSPLFYNVISPSENDSAAKKIILILRFVLFSTIKKNAFYLISQVTIDHHPIRFFVHKRPHVDFFLECVSLPFTSFLQKMSTV